MQPIFSLTFPWGGICFPALAYSGREARITGPNTHLSNEHSPQNWMSFGHQPSLFFFLTLWENFIQLRVLCPWVLQASPEQASSPFGSTSWRCTFRREGEGRGDGLGLPLGSHLPWPMSSFPEFQGTLQTRLSELRNRSVRSDQMSLGMEMASCLIFSRLCHRCQEERSSTMEDTWVSPDGFQAQLCH